MKRKYSPADELWLVQELRRRAKVTHDSTLPIVGAYYRPPAKAVLDALPIGAPLTLIAEPDNPHDINAIAVWVQTSDIPDTSYDKLRELLPDYGYTLENLLKEEAFHLGYIPRDLAAKLRSDGTVLEDEPVSGRFSTSASGTPRVRLLRPGVEV